MKVWFWRRCRCWKDIYFMSIAMLSMLPLNNNGAQNCEISRLSFVVLRRNAMASF